MLGFLVMTDYVCLSGDDGLCVFKISGDDGMCVF